MRLPVLDTLASSQKLRGRRVPSLSVYRRQHARLRGLARTRPLPMPSVARFQIARASRSGRRDLAAGRPCGERIHPLW